MFVWRTCSVLEASRSQWTRRSQGFTVICRVSGCQIACSKIRPLLISDKLQVIWAEKCVFPAPTRDGGSLNQYFNIHATVQKRMWSGGTLVVTQRESSSHSAVPHQQYGVLEFFNPWFGSTLLFWSFLTTFLCVASRCCRPLFKNKNKNPGPTGCYLQSTCKHS